MNVAALISGPLTDVLRNIFGEDVEGLRATFYVTVGAAVLEVCLCDVCCFEIIRKTKQTKKILKIFKF